MTLPELRLVGSGSHQAAPCGLCRWKEVMQAELPFQSSVLDPGLEAVQLSCLTQQVLRHLTIPNT